MKTLLPLLLIICTLPITAQDYPTKSDPNVVMVQQDSDVPSGILQEESSKPSNVPGNRYLEELATEGFIVFHNSKKKYLFSQIRYNIYSSDLEVEVFGKTRYIRLPKVYYFILNQNGKLRRFFRWWWAEKKVLVPVYGYYETLIYGKASVVRYTYVGVNSKTVLGNTREKFFRGEQYFFLKGNKLYKAHKRRQIKKLLTTEGFDAKKVIKQQKLKIKDIYDLVTLVELFNAHHKK